MCRTSWYQSRDVIRRLHRNFAVLYCLSNDSGSGILEPVPSFGFTATRGGGKPEVADGMAPSGSGYISRSAEDSWSIHGFKAPSILKYD